MTAEQRPPLLLDWRFLLIGGVIAATVAVLATGLAGVFTWWGLFGAVPEQDDPERIRYETTYRDIEQVMTGLAEAQRGKLLGDGEAFSALVSREAARRAIVAAAREEGLDARPDVAYIMRRSAEDLLVNAYMNEHTGDMTPVGFPDDAQVREFYEKNQQQFSIEARAHIYQIFLPLAADAGKAEEQALKDKAAGIAASINQGKLDFATAAARHSAHGQSRLNGGYVGLIKESQLLPELREAILSLPEGRVSAPLRSRTGIHLFMRGEKVPAQPVALDQVREQIRKLLSDQYRSGQQNRLVKGISAEHSVGVSPSDIDEWRRRLRATVWPPDAAHRNNE